MSKHLIRVRNGCDQFGRARRLIVEVPVFGISKEYSMRSFDYLQPIDRPRKALYRFAAERKIKLRIISSEKLNHETRFNVELLEGNSCKERPFK